MTNQHPITPPLELVQQWAAINGTHYEDLATLCGHLCTQAAQWGADQELLACCVLMDEWGLDGKDLMECRRPKPPSLKEQALEALKVIECEYVIGVSTETIRRALEALDG